MGTPQGPLCCSEFALVSVSSERASSGYASAMVHWDHRLMGRKGFAVLPPPQALLRPEAGQIQCFTREVDILGIGVKQGCYPHCPEQQANLVSGLLQL